MATNVLLCRWADGFHEVKHQGSIDAIGRREALLGLGALDALEEVERVANMQLSVVAFPRTAIATDLAPIDRTDRPYFAFNVGDTITVPDYATGTISQRVRSITGAEDDNGEITYAPELGDLILEEQERTLQAVKKMSDGTLEGDSPVAQPVLRAQPIRVWTTPAMPTGVLAFGLQWLRPVSYLYEITEPATTGFAGTDYTLTEFTVTIDSSDPDETTRFALWQDGANPHDIATIDLGPAPAPGTYTGVIHTPAVTIGDGDSVFMYGGGSRGNVHARFTEDGATVTLPTAPTYEVRSYGYHYEPGVPPPTEPFVPGETSATFTVAEDTYITTLTCFAYPATNEVNVSGLDEYVNGAWQLVASVTVTWSDHVAQTHLNHKVTAGTQLRLRAMSGHFGPIVQNDIWMGVTVRGSDADMEIDWNP